MAQNMVVTALSQDETGVLFSSLKLSKASL